MERSVSIILGILDYFSHSFMLLYQFIIVRNGNKTKCDNVELTIAHLSAMTVRDIQKRLKKLGNKEHAAISQRFFKTGPGEYGEGDVFIGVTVPELRKLAKEYKRMPKMS